MTPEEQRAIQSIRRAGLAIRVLIVLATACFILIQLGGW